jgi:hypothetical protein
MDYISIKEAAEKWGISERRIQQLCENSRIPGVVRFVRVWAIPRNAEKPLDARTRAGRKSKAQKNTDEK